MNNKIKNILLKLTEKGFEAYVVGGYVRDYLLGKETYDVDIATNATPKDVIEIFNITSSTDDNYGSVKFKDSIYNYDITTYRKDIKYENRKPVEYEFTDNIEEDVKRRDFTINSLYMDSNSKIYDLVNGQKDIVDGIVRVVGNIDDKMNEDPLRLLRAIRFATKLDFTIDDKLSNYIRQNKMIIRTLSNTRRKEELDKIFKSENTVKGIKLIKELGIEEDLEIKIPDNIIITDNYLGIWSQIEIIGDYSFSTKEQDIIDQVKKIIKYGMIDNIVLYQYGLYASVIAGELLNTTRSYISDIYKNLPIYSIKDIDIDGDEIIELLNIEPSETIKDIYHDLEISILNNIIKNNKEEIKEYIVENWR